jgi:hypothetical protein
LATVLVFAAISASGCELVLGELPPAKQHDAGAVGGASGATSHAATTQATGALSSSSSAESSTGADACCDCDHDGHNAEGACGGDDCDDHDVKVYPKEPTYYAVANTDPAVGFDWDCSGAPERDPTLDKVVDCQPIAIPCPAGTGFLGKVAPPCGMPGEWGSCKTQGAMCVKDVVDAQKLMACK